MVSQLCLYMTAHKIITRSLATRPRDSLVGEGDLKKSTNQVQQSYLSDQKTGCLVYVDVLLGRGLVPADETFLFAEVVHL